MKKTRSFLAILAALCLMVSLVGCSVRSSVDGTTFKTAAEAAGFTVEETPVDGVSAYMVAITANNTTVVFADFTATDDGKIAAMTAKDFYAQLKSSITESGAAEKNNVDSATYSKFHAANGDSNYQLIRLNDTALYAEYTVSDKEAVESLFKAIGY